MCHITVHDSFALSIIGLLSHGAGRLADQATLHVEAIDRYKELTTSHFLFP